MTEYLPSLRNYGYQLVPRWARGPRLTKLLYAIWTVADEIATMCLMAIKIRFPGVFSYESVPRIASERHLFQGPNELVAHFCERLKTWWDVGKHSGNFYTMAQQIQAYCLPAKFVVEIVQNNGVRYTLGTDGSFSMDQTTWNWDGDSKQWSRFWVLLSNSALGVTGTSQPVDSSLIHPGAIITVKQPGRDVGEDTPYLNYSTSPIPDHKSIRRIMEFHRCPHAFCSGIILLLYHDAFWLHPPTPNADAELGTWNQWKNRDSVNARYWAGTPR